MNLLIKLLSSPWFWVDVLLSVSGGAVVWWGLRIEKKAEKMLPPDNFKPDIFDDIVEQQKAELDRGWKILMAGIVFEVVAALGISIISGLEIADLKEKSSSNELARVELEKQIAQTKTNVAAIDPLKQPIASLSAFVTFTVSSHVELRSSSGRQGLMTNDFWGGFFGVETLANVGAITFGRNMKDTYPPNDDSIRVSMKLPDKVFRSTWRSSESSGDFFEFEIPERTDWPMLDWVDVQELIDGLDSFVIEAWLLPKDSVITEGAATLTINSLTKIHFSIPQSVVGETTVVKGSRIKHSLLGAKKNRMLGKLDMELQDPGKTPAERDKLKREFTKIYSEIMTAERGLPPLPTNFIVPFFPDVLTNAAPK